MFSVTNSTGKNLALKCLFPDLITTERRKRFKNEVGFCSRQSHRNIIQIVDCGLVTWGGKKTPFYVMPFFPMTLRGLMNKGIPHSRVLLLFSQMLDGIEAAHLLEIIHRDVKPENFLYEPDRELLLVADFGIAHFREDMLATAVATKATAKMANLGYSAPEQRTKGAPVDHRSDIYALGLILNEMFTGLVPHGAGYKTIASVAPDYAYLDPLVERMIQQSSEARPLKLEEVKKDLIGRQNAFVVQQQLDLKKREVVPTSIPQQVVPVKLMGADWNQDTLIFKLDRVPEAGWVQRFRDPRGGYSSIRGAEPHTFQFNGNQAIVRADERVVQQIVNNFKIYLDMATRGYQEDLDVQAAEQELKRRQKLKQEVAEVEKRKRILENLKV